MNENQKLTEKIEAEGRKAVEFFSGLEGNVWQVELYADGEQWTVREVLAHIVEAEFSLRQLFASIAAGGRGVPEEFDIDRYNAGALGDLTERTLEELLSLFKARRAEMVTFAASLSPEDLDKRGRHPFLGETSLGEMLRLFYMHVNLHIRDIRKAMGS